MRMALALSLLVVTASPACAGWQWTEWGMSSEELRAALPNGIETAADVQHEAAGIIFSVGFRILDNGLEQVSLYPAAYTDCHALLKNLEAAYGPAKAEGNSVYTWASDAAGNAVTFSIATSNVCVIEYSPAYSPNTDGL